MLFEQRCKAEIVLSLVFLITKCMQSQHLHRVKVGSVQSNLTLQHLLRILNAPVALNETDVSPIILQCKLNLSVGENVFI